MVKRLLRRIRRLPAVDTVLTRIAGQFTTWPADDFGRFIGASIGTGMAGPIAALPPSVEPLRPPPPTSIVPPHPAAPVPTAAAVAATSAVRAPSSSFLRIDRTLFMSMISLIRSGSTLSAAHMAPMVASRLRIRPGFSAPRWREGVRVRIFFSRL